MPIPQKHSYGTQQTSQTPSPHIAASAQSCAGLAQNGLSSVPEGLARYPEDITIPNILHRPCLLWHLNVYFKKNSLIARLNPNIVIMETIMSEKANCHCATPSSSKATRVSASEEEIKHPCSPAVQGRTPFNGRIVPSKHTGLFKWSGNSMDLINHKWCTDTMPGSKVKEKISNQALWISNCVRHIWRKAMNAVK